MWFGARSLGQPKAPTESAVVVPSDPQLRPPDQPHRWVSYYDCWPQGAEDLRRQRRFRSSVGWNARTMSDGSQSSTPRPSRASSAPFPLPYCCRPSMLTGYRILQDAHDGRGCRLDPGAARRAARSGAKDGRARPSAWPGPSSPSSFSPSSPLKALFLARLPQASTYYDWDSVRAADKYLDKLTSWASEGASFSMCVQTPPPRKAHRSFRPNTSLDFTISGLPTLFKLNSQRSGSSPAPSLTRSTPLSVPAKARTFGPPSTPPERVGRKRSSSLPAGRV